MNGMIGLRLEQHSGSGGAHPEESSYPVAPGRGPRRGRVLIMDDDRSVRETMYRQMTILGFEVVATADGREAVDAYREARASGRPFAAVILDLMVPEGWGGEQALAELRKLDPGVKALVCSGSLSGPVADYRAQGFCGVLCKPYALGELRGLVEAAVLSAGRG